MYLRAYIAIIAPPPKQYPLNFETFLHLLGMQMMLPRWFRKLSEIISMHQLYS
jgi:hypothetical protein